jgi:hypothetical protein
MAESKRDCAFFGSAGALYFSLCEKSRKRAWCAGVDVEPYGRRTWHPPQDDLYFVAPRETAGGFDSTGRCAVAALTLATPSTSDAQTGVTFGMRHLFRAQRAFA